MNNNNNKKLNKNLSARFTHTWNEHIWALNGYSSSIETVQQLKLKLPYWEQKKDPNPIQGSQRTIKIF